MRIGRLRIVWALIVALSFLVLFLYCFAEVGGDPDPIRQPTGAPVTAPPVEN